MDRESLPKTLGGIFREIDGLKHDLTEPGDLPSLFILLRASMRPKITKVLVEERTIGTAFILSHTANSLLGTSALGPGTMSGYYPVEEKVLNQDFTSDGKNEIRDWLVNSTSYSASLISVGNLDTVFDKYQRYLSKKIYQLDSINTVAAKKNIMVINFVSTLANLNLITDSIKEVGVEGNA